MVSPRRYIAAAGRTARTLLFIIFCKVLYRFWPSKLRSMVDGNRSEVKIQGSMRFISSFNLLTTWIRMERKRLAETAEQGKPFLDFSLVALDSKQEMRLSDLVKKAGVRPLILNFGSCS